MVKFIHDGRVYQLLDFAKDWARVQQVNCLSAIPGLVDLPQDEPFKIIFHEENKGVELVRKVKHAIIVYVKRSIG